MLPINGKNQSIRKKETLKKTKENPSDVAGDDIPKSDVKRKRRTFN